MSSPTAAAPGTLVAMKANLNGHIHRFKLPLRDLEANTFEAKLRNVLDIPPEFDCLIDRYSDSAGAWIRLDASNSSVYKQLYRAAKAKQKLKLRIVANLRSAETRKAPPKAVSIEDEPEPETPTPAPVPAPTPISAEPSPAEESQEPINPPSLPSVVTDPPSVESMLRRHLVPAADEAFRSSITLMEKEHEKMTRNFEKIEASIAALNNNLPFPIRLSQSLDALCEAQHIPTSSVDAPAPTAQAITESAATISPLVRARLNFTVCCNKCDEHIPYAHYHCASCDHGDFDLCQSCVDKGATCHGEDHWLIKRFIENGAVINSTTETIRPKPKVPSHVKPKPLAEIDFAPERPDNYLDGTLRTTIRTCNSCVGELPEKLFLHCDDCEDFDLCRACFIKNEHGHHPKHSFVPAVEGTSFDHEVTRRLAPGRYQEHTAVCDGCDQTIRGVRHKCLDCPDWDYCNNCIVDAGFIHPNHRFVPVYEPLETTGEFLARTDSRVTHDGICCDGPLCNSVPPFSSKYIVGDRYKCAVCNDTDFCANCEASPANTHNKTHPLIKFKTAIKRVNVTTTGEHHASGVKMPIMGDRPRSIWATTRSRATETTLSSQQIVQTGVLTVADLRPSEPATPAVVQEPPVPVQPRSLATDYVAIFKRDTIPDGTVMAPTSWFTQTWFLTNQGTVPWPAGCSMKFVGGDYMGSIDPKRPVCNAELATACLTSTQDSIIEPGQEVPFTVLLRAPHREGKAISYWRLITKDGVKFGPRLWCDINVQPVEAKEEEIVKEDIKEEEPEEEVKIKEEPREDIKKDVKEDTKEDTKEDIKEEPKVEKTESSSPTTQDSQMIFPKLEKESPVSSVYEEPKEPKSDAPPAYEEEFEDCGDDDEWAEDDSEAGFLTDEEYDILDASDEENRDSLQKRALKK